LKTKPRTLWVDAVCINQDDDDDEKGVQMPFMGIIYQQAHPIIVWLGEDQDGSALTAFETVAKIHGIGRKFGLGSLEPARSTQNSREASVLNKVVCRLMRPKSGALYKKSTSSNSSHYWAF
jgi:hypothetical protein